MTSAYESVISDDQLAELSILVTSKGITLAAACEELCEDVIDARCDEAASINDYTPDRTNDESVLAGKEAEDSTINNQGLEDQIRYLYDAYDFDIVKTLVLGVVANLKSGR